jgi:SAM-dependent methyltransferase
MSLQDVDHMERAVAEAARVLVPGGRLVIAVTHPANTAGKFAPGPDEAARPFVIDGSWFEHRALADTCERDGYTMTFHSRHRPLQAYTEALADAGFLIERIREVGDPNPADKWHRIPLFLHIRALRSGDPPTAAELLVVIPERMVTPSDLNTGEGRAHFRRYAWQLLRDGLSFLPHRNGCSGRNRLAVIATAGALRSEE